MIRAAQLIYVLELFSILVALSIWGQELSNRKICIKCDNMSVCHIINKMTSKSELVMILVRNLTLKCLQRNIVIKAEHISGVHNKLSDSPSRLQVQ